MKKLLGFVMPLKTYAAMLFAGLMCLYMIGGVLIAYVYPTNAALSEPFSFSIPFIFVVEGLVLSALIAVLWGVFFNSALTKKWRYFPRLVVFSLLLFALFALCLLVFFAVPTNWAKLWWVVAICIEVGVIVLSLIAEFYYRKTGKRYTEVLNTYKANSKL